MTFKGRNIVHDYDTKYQHAYYAWNAFFPRADEDLRFYLGDQWTEQERAALFEEGRSALTVNRIKPNINMICGYQVKHALSSTVIPRSKNDEKLAEQLSKIVIDLFDAEDFYQEISAAFKGSVITGWNLLSLWVDYREDPLGSVKVRREPYNAFITDPYFSKGDLSDCGYILRRKYITLEQAISLLPEERKLIEGLYKKGPIKDDKFTWLPYARLPSGQTMIAYDEYWEQDWEREKVLIDIETGEQFDWDGDEGVLYVNENFQVIERSNPVVYQHIIVNGNYIKTEKNPNGLNEYPFVPFYAIFEPESDQWALKIQSIVRQMKDVQKESNKRRSQLVDIVESQLNSGWVAEDGSVVNPRSLFQTGQGRVVWRKKGSDPGSLTRLDAAQVPPAFFQSKDSFDSDIQFVANITEELMGMDSNANDSGLKVHLRQSAALVGLQGLFENLRNSQKLLTRKVIKILPSLTTSKLKKILEEEPDPRILDQRNLKYDIAVQEGTLTSTQQELFFKQLVTLKELGEAVPQGLLAQAAPLQGKSDYNKAIQQQAEAQQQAAAEQQKLQDSLLRSQEMLANSQSLADMALAKERIEKAESDRIEKAAKSVEDRADATLRRVETLRRLEDLDDARLDRMIGLMERMDALVKSEEQQLKAEAGAKSAAALSEKPTTQEVQGGI